MSSHKYLTSICYIQFECKLLYLYIDARQSTEGFHLFVVCNNKTDQSYVGEQTILYVNKLLHGLGNNNDSNISHCLFPYKLGVSQDCEPPILQYWTG